MVTRVPNNVCCSPSPVTATTNQPIIVSRRRGTTRHQSLSSSLPPPIASHSNNFSSPPSSFLRSSPPPPPPMDGEHRSSYDEALNRLSSLITKRTRGDGSNRGNEFDLMEVYLKMLDLEDAISDLKVIHVAGTKGKGSTCAFAESILRSCGLRTGLFTSPHLIDIRERFKLDGVEISEEKFLEYFWWCWDRLKEKTSDSDVPMPTFFRFLALLAFKIFSAEQVDATIVEVGLGGRFDATNVVKAPVVCGVASLGYDHMEILGNTLGQIAFEKAGIFKEAIPAYTVPQPKEAMCALEKTASRLGISLLVAPPLDIGKLEGKKLGLDGEHQYLNAGLAVTLCHAWFRGTGLGEGIYLQETSSLPEQFINGLATASLSGRAQIIRDLQFPMQSHGHLSVGGLIFYLDGAHSPESIDACARWFSHATKSKNMDSADKDNSAKKILLFNCMSVRDPQVLLPRLVNSCADNDVRFHKALFVPNQSVYHKVDSYAAPEVGLEVDLSWQKKLQKVWESTVHGDRGSKANGTNDMNPNNTKWQESSAVFPSLPMAIKWLRDISRENCSCQFQVLVTGSLHLVGDVLRLMKK